MCTTLVSLVVYLAADYAITLVPVPPLISPRARTDAATLHLTDVRRTLIRHPEPRTHRTHRVTRGGATELRRHPDHAVRLRWRSVIRRGRRRLTALSTLLRSFGPRRSPASPVDTWLAPHNPSPSLVTARNPSFLPHSFGVSDYHSGCAGCAAFGRPSRPSPCRRRRCSV